MSATVDARRFSNYLNGAPILDIPGRTFPVEVQFLEDAIELSGHRFEDSRDRADTDDTDDESPERAPEGDNDLASSLSNYSSRTRDIVMKHNPYRMDYKLIVDLLSTIATSPKLSDYSKAMLVFMPGLAEIRRLHDEIMSVPLFQRGWVVHSLHSSIATEDQEKAFIVPQKGVRKIVIATNIAETGGMPTMKPLLTAYSANFLTSELGITIPDITAVVDTGKEKVMR
jgi:ATP-dependent RNA helicase DHX29